MEEEDIIKFYEIAKNDTHLRLTNSSVSPPQPPQEIAGLFQKPHKMILWSLFPQLELIWTLTRMVSIPPRLGCSIPFQIYFLLVCRQSQ